MIKFNLFIYFIFSIISYIFTVAIVIIFSTDALLKFIFVLLILAVISGILSFYLSEKIKKILVEKSSSFLDIKINHLLIITIYLIGSLYSLYLGAIFMESILGIDVFGNSDSLWTKLFLQGDESSVGDKYFIYQLMWFGISYLIYTFLLKVFNSISIMKNDGFHLNDIRLVKPLLKWFTLFVGIVAVMGIGVNFINHDNYVYDKETDILYKVIEVNYEIQRIEKLTQEELQHFNNTYVLGKMDPTLNFFMFSLLFLIPYIQLIFKNE